MNDKNKYFRFKVNIIELLSEKGITAHSCKPKGKHEGMFSQGTLTHLKKGENISLNTACKICSILGCELSDIIEIIPGDEDTTA